MLLLFVISLQTRAVTRSVFFLVNLPREFHLQHREHTMQHKYCCLRPLLGFNGHLLLFMNSTSYSIAVLGPKLALQLAACPPTVENPNATASWNTISPG